ADRAVKAPLFRSTGGIQVALRIASGSRGQSHQWLPVKQIPGPLEGINHSRRTTNEMDVVRVARVRVKQHTGAGHDWDDMFIAQRRLAVVGHPNSDKVHWLQSLGVGQRPTEHTVIGAN